MITDMAGRARAASPGAPPPSGRPLSGGWRTPDLMRLNVIIQSRPVVDSDSAGMTGDTGPQGRPRAALGADPPVFTLGPRGSRSTCHEMFPQLRVHKNYRLPMFDRHHERVIHTLRNGLVILK